MAWEGRTADAVLLKDASAMDSAAVVAVIAWHCQLSDSLPGGQGRPFLEGLKDNACEHGWLCAAQGLGKDGWMEDMCLCLRSHSSANEGKKSWALMCQI